jgi:hypothetical protein
MTTKTLLLLAAVALLAAGVWLILASFHHTPGSSPVTVFNYDPPGLPYTLITLRSGPGSDYDRIGFLDPGATAEAVGRDAAGGWLLLDEPRGWVSISAGEVAGDIDALPLVDVTIEPPLVPLVTVLVSEDVAPAEKRIGPADAFPAVGPLEAGVPVVAIARDPTGRWVLIEPAGWIAVGDLEVTGDVEGLPVIRIEF